MKKYFIKSFLAFSLMLSFCITNETFAAVTITKTDGFSDGVALVAGADDVTVLEFVLENTESDDVEITQIDINAVGSSTNFTNYISAPFVLGVQQGAGNILAVDGSASFDDVNVVIPAGTTKEFVIIIDTITATVNDDISFTVTNIVADNISNGNPIDITDNGIILGATGINETLTGTDENCDGDVTDTNTMNYLCGSSFELVESGILTVSEYEKFVSDIIVANSTDVEVLSIRFDAQDDSIEINDIYLENDLDGDGEPDNLEIGDLLTFKLYNEAGMLVQEKTMIDGELHFDNLDSQLSVPKNDYTFVTIKVDASDIVSATDTGERLRLALDSDNVIHGGIEAITASTGDAIPFDSSVRWWGEAKGEDFVVYNSETSVRHAFSQPTITDPSVDSMEIYRFVVSADSNNEVEIGRITMEVSLQGMQRSGDVLQASDFMLYNFDSVSGVLTTPVEDATVTIESGSTANKAKVILDYGSENITKGTNKTYSILLNNTEDTGADNNDDSVVVKILTDNDYTIPDTKLNISSNNNLVWSDEASSSHTDSTLDWENGYLVEVDTESQINSDSGILIAVSEVIPVPTTTTDSTPSYEFELINSGSGTVTYGGSCSSSTTDVLEGTNTITFDTLAEGTYSDCTITVTDIFSNVSNVLTVSSFTVTSDVTAPFITGITSISSLTNDNTPSFVFNTDEEGTITYGGSCTSAETTAVVGDNTITLNTIADGTYSDCTIQVTDASSNASNILTIPEFTIDTTSPTVTVEQKTGQADPTEVDLASFTITFNEEIDSATFTASDITITGSGTVLSGPFEVSTNVYEISINGMIDDGTTSVSIPANVVSDLAGNLNTASTSTDNSVTYEIATSTSSSSGGGGGGGSTTIHKVYMCKDPDGCNYVYPTGNDEDYQNYETCYKTGEGTGTECARLWALENGYVDPADYNPAVVTSDTSTTSTSDAPSAGSCPAKQFNRSPERRGHGLRDRTIFRDAQPSHFAYSALMDLGEQEVVNGDDDTGYARLDDNLNRAEFVKIMTISREDQLQAGYCTERFVFPDVEYGEWYYEFVQNMQEEGIIEGYDNGYYRPGRDINFAEAYKIMAISFGYITYDEAVAQSAANDSAWYAPYKDALENAGVLPSRLERKNNSEKISRGETFLLLSEILKEVDAR